MGVSNDEASWVVTTYLVANAVSLTASPFLAKRLGRKVFFLLCLGLFSLTSILCAQAWNLDSLLLFRLLQGLAGGGMVPVSQSILADSFPPEKRGQAFALFGIAVVVAPVVGPTLGGWLADNLTWRWCFLINGPVGIVTIALIAAVLPADRPNQAGAARFDVIGFLLVATFLGALELVQDRGLDDDWFGSNFIVTCTIICAVAFVTMIPWEMSRSDPMIDVRMVATRQFGASFVVMGATGAILYATTQFLLLLVQTDFGYTATWAGLVLSPGGVVTMAMMFAVGSLASRIQPKYLIMASATLSACRSASGCRSSSFRSWPRPMTGFRRPRPIRRPRSSTPRATPAGQSASRSPRTCSRIARSSTRAGSSSTPFRRASNIRTLCIRRRNIFSPRAVCPRRRASRRSAG
jgi:DHA2 family multidrug resistance protein